MRSESKSLPLSEGDPAVSLLPALLKMLIADIRKLAGKAEAAAALLEAKQHDPGPQPGSRSAAQILIDTETFSVHWRGKICRLGYTVPFRLMAHLARHSDRFIPHQQLLDDVWGGPRSASAVRSAVTYLRARLVEAGMQDLAAAIEGHNSGHYGLMVRQARGKVTSD